ncbi:MAG TPA: sulfatase-like hydrolase/transferase, partial [Opitutus sp.]|nr:sulfatase-like hydrolase/transferase [Opitutus sp.]
PHAELKVPGDSIAELKARQEWARATEASASSIAFAAMVTRLDRDVGRLLAKLKELGLEDDTLVIFTSDNGAHEEDEKDNAFFKASGPLRGIKRDMYEGGMRVPFLARWPGRIAAGRTTGHVAAFWDFLPTAAELAGVPVPPSAGDGLSYLPDLLGKDGQRQHGHLYWELLIKAQGRQAARVGDWKAVRYGQDAPIELYNVQADPGETTNEASREPGRVAQFTQLFHEARTDSPDFPLRLPAGVNNSNN